MKVLLLLTVLAVATTLTEQTLITKIVLKKIALFSRPKQKEPEKPQVIVVYDPPGTAPSRPYPPSHPCLPTYPCPPSHPYPPAAPPCNHTTTTTEEPYVFTDSPPAVPHSVYGIPTVAPPVEFHPTEVLQEDKVLVAPHGVVVVEEQSKPLYTQESSFGVNANGHAQVVVQDDRVPPGGFVPQLTVPGQGAPALVLFDGPNQIPAFKQGLPAASYGPPEGDATVW